MSLTKITRTVVDSISSFFNVNNTTGAITSVVPDLIDSNTTLYPSFACRAWVNFNGTVADNLTGTYSQSGTTVTVTINNHGLLSGHSISVDATTGTAVDGVYTVTGVTDANTFTYTAGTSLTTSGNITLLRRLIRGSGNVSSVMRNGTGDYTINFTTAMPDTNYSFTFGAQDIAATGFPSLSGSFYSNPTISSLRIGVDRGNNATGDIQTCNVAIFR